MQGRKTGFREHLRVLDEVDATAPRRKEERLRNSPSPEWLTLALLEAFRLEAELRPDRA
jgi:hypothetical protein